MVQKQDTLEIEEAMIWMPKIALKEEKGKILLGRPSTIWKQM